MVRFSIKIVKIMTKPKKTIMITGGLGHIGSKLIRRLPKSYKIIVIDDLSTQRYCSLFNLNRDINFIEQPFVKTPVDILKKSDIIIHLAAMTDATSSFSNKKTETINVEHTKDFIDKCEKEFSGKVIFTSSTSVYGVSSDIVSEDDESFLNPQSPYAETKIEIENYLKTKSINHIILRLGTIFGCSPGMRFHTAINKFCYQAALGIPLTVWEQNYNQYRPYLGIKDCIRAMNIFIKGDQYNETYNVITDNYKLSQIINYIEKIKPITINMIDTPLLNQYSYKVSSQKLSHLGFHPKDDLVEAIKSTIERLRCLKAINI